MSKSERAEAIAYLREHLPAGSTVFLTLSGVSRSGISRTIKCLTKDMENISYYVAKATENRLKDGYSGGVVIGGCGMDMGLALTEQLSYALYEKPTQQRSDEPNGGIQYRWV